MKTKELTDKTIEWLLKPKKDTSLFCSMVFTEVELYKPNEFNELIDLLGFPKQFYIYANMVPLLIEIKVSRQDFINNAKKKLLTGVADRYYFAPKGVINVGEVPDNWGLIECWRNRFYIRKHPSNYRDAQKIDYEFFYKILCRRLAVMHTAIFQTDNYAVNYRNVIIRMNEMNHKNWFDIPEYLGY